MHVGDLVRQCTLDAALRTPQPVLTGFACASPDFNRGRSPSARNYQLLLFLLLALLLTGCTAAPPRLPPTPTPAPPTPPAFVTLPAAEAIPQIIAAERDASRRGDLPLLTQLWAEDARITDSRGTDDPADDFVWPDRAAILDRYTLAVFPAPPPALESLPAPAITVEGNGAQALNGQDRWRFVRWDGRWWMAELRY